jgi:DNA polymerase III delta prime subunit
MEKVTKYNWPTDLNDRTARNLEALLELGQSSPHAYLFVGSELEGESVAIELAKYISGINFPNIDTLMFEGSSGDIDDMREIVQLSALKPVLAQKKVILLKSLDKTSPQVLSVLLKTLEEPPQQSVFILLSSRPLLPTIMSRCQVINLSHSGEIELPEKLKKLFQEMENNRHNGLTEKLALVITLAELENDQLVQLIEQWMVKQTQELKDNPAQYPAVRATMETLQSLQGNFNKKMVLQNFVTQGLK